MSSALKARGNDNSKHLSPTLICVIVVSIIASMSIITFIVAWFTIRCRRRHDEEAPNLKEDEDKAEKTFRRKTADLDRLEEEELQRQVMIRKSLASRTSLRTSSQIYEDEEPEAERPKSLRMDWKKWEAGIQHQRSLSTETHPGIDPTSRHTINSFATPTYSRSGSPAGLPLLDSMPQLPVPSRTVSSSDRRQPATEGLEELQALKRSIQQQILRKNSEARL